MSESTRPRPAIDPGSADFAALREQHFYYVDKTSWLPQFIGTGAGPVLITRPRRFGKTLFMDTLRRFLELNYPRARRPQRHPGLV